MTDREYLEIQRRATKYSRSESRTRKQLVIEARKGNPAAVARLHETYRITLPLVEAAMRRPRTRSRTRSARSSRA